MHRAAVCAGPIGPSRRRKGAACGPFEVVSTLHTLPTQDVRRSREKAPRNLWVTRRRCRETAGQGSVRTQTRAQSHKIWWRGLDLNQRPLGYEPNELPDCSTPLGATLPSGDKSATRTWGHA